MATNTLYAAESWDKIYQAFGTVNFSSYDYDTIKESLIQQLQTSYPENFNDFIESSEMMMFIESFSYIAELLAYRVDMAMHENSMDTAERKQSILRLAKFISYNATRNLPARGLVKIASISTTERIIDSNGNNLANRNIIWNDPNNALWKEQFFLVMDRSLAKPFGQPSKIFKISDVEFQQYEFRNTENSIANGVFPYSVTANSETVPMEIVSADIDKDGPFERYVDGRSKMFILHANDGLGDSSDMTGFLMYTKQGRLSKTSISFNDIIPNRTVDIDNTNINNVDVWVNKVDGAGLIQEKWTEVDNVSAQSVYFNVDKETKKFEIETLDEDRIRLIFGDGDFADIPSGNFEVWTRQSLNRDIVIHKNRVVNEPMNFSYKSNFDIEESTNLTFSLVSTLQNASVSEDIEHIRRNAPQTYYSQNRMVNGQDYNSLLLRDSSVLKLRAVNRTFAGQPKYLEWNDASGNYQNIKIFGDDLRVYYDFKLDSITTTTSARSLIDEIIEPLLEKSGLQNLMTHSGVAAGFDKARTAPRHSFIERFGVGLQEKTKIQGALDRHYYGEPTEFSMIDSVRYGIVDNDSDYKIYQSDLPMIVAGEIYQNGNPSGLQTGASIESNFGLRFDRTRPIYGNGNIEITLTGFAGLLNETWVVECINDEDDVSTFSVTGSKSGNVGTAQSDILFSSDKIKFIINQSTEKFIAGDSFILNEGPLPAGSLKIVEWDSSDPQFQAVNLNGEWNIIPGASLSVGDYDYSTAGTDSDNSWAIMVQRNDDEFGEIIDWTITYRNLKIVSESPTTKFWYNSNDIIIDSGTKNRVRDTVSVLKSNLNSEGTFAIGKNHMYDVVDGVDFDDGSQNINALEIYPASNIDAKNAVDVDRSRSVQFTEFVNTVGSVDYVYFKVADSGHLQAIDDVTPSIVSNFTGMNSKSDDGLYERKIGRNGLDFLWQHFTPNSNLIDPSPSNIIDVFVLTKGYLDSVKSYISGETAYRPVAPTPLELRNTYRDLLKTKMISDTVVMHSGKLKLLFGPLADSQVRGKFRVIKSSNATLTDDQIKAEILNVIDIYFSIQHWDFGDTFYATDLFALVHKRLATQISSIVLVPTFVNNTFGSMFVTESSDDEILLSAATVDDIELVDAFTPKTLRQSI